MWRYFITDSFTGAPKAEVYPVAGSARTVINGVGTGQHEFRLRGADDGLSQARWWDLSTPWANTLTVCWDRWENIVYDGFIIRDRYRKRTGALTISHSEMRVIMKGRYQYAIYTHDSEGAFVIEGKSLRGVANAIVRRGLLSATTPGDWELPVVADTDEAGAESRRYPAHRFQSTEQMLTEIQNAPGGPEVHFQPRVNAAGRREWQARFGTPTLSGPSIELNAMAPEGGALDFGLDRDGANQITGVWSLGEGAEVDMRIGRAGDMPGTRIPNIDLPRPFKTMREQDVLDGAAWAALTADREATIQYSNDILARDAFPRMRLGSPVRVWDRGDEYIPDGWHESRLIGYTITTGSARVGLELQ